MKRRELLKTVAASGLVSAGIGTVAAGSNSRPESAPKPGSIDELDALHIIRDDEIVKSVENPTIEDLKRMEASLGEDEQLVNNDYECSTYCYEDCDVFCDDCWWACSCTACSTCCRTSSTA